MKDYRLTVFYATESCLEKTKTSLKGKVIKHFIPQSLAEEFSVESLIKDQDYNIFAIELCQEYKAKIKDILEVLEENINTVCIVIESESDSVLQYSRNATFHRNLIQQPFSPVEIKLITELGIVRHEKKILKRRSRLFSEAVNQSANSIIITNPQGIIEYVNRNFEEKTGYTFQEVLGKHTRILKSEQNDEEVYEKMWKIISMGIKWEGELLNKKKSGELFWEEITISPITDESGNILHHLAIKTDISDRKKADDQVRNSKLILREIIDRVPQFIFIRDIESRYHLVNKAFAEFRGKTPQEIKGKTEIELSSSPHKLEEFFWEDRRVIEQNIEIKGEALVFDPTQNRERHFRYTKVPFILPRTGETAVLSVWTCVTDQKHNEQLLTSAREKLLDAQKLASFGNWSVDTIKNEAQWSEQVYEQYGLPIDKPAPAGEEFYNHVHPDDVGHIKLAIKKARDEGYAKYECRAIKPGNQYTYIEATVKPVYTDDKVTGYFGTSLDITARKQVEEEMTAARKEAIAASKAKSDFLSVMSHEIRTPLNAIIVMTEMLVQEINQPEHNDNLEILNFSAKDLLGIVNDILDYSKIEAGKLELENIDVDIKDFSSKILRANYLRAQEKGISLELEYDDTIPEVITGDPLRMGQILNNLLSNAVKFTEKGGVKLTVTKKSMDEDCCRIYFGIKDSGIGIHPDKIQSLFEVFTQASSETSRKYGGTGLGLAIVKNLLIAHNSEIHVESQPGEGSLFWFEIDFPYKIFKDTPDQERPQVKESGNLENVKIMLVEDNAMNIMVAKKIFDKWRCKISVAEDGYIAMEKATRNDYDLILMDLQMPGIDGFETTRKLRKLSEHYSTMPIIALSAAAPQEVKEKVLQAGMNELVTKPFNPKELYNLIKKYLPDIPSITYEKITGESQDIGAEDKNSSIDIQVLVKLRTVLDKKNSKAAINYIEQLANKQALPHKSNDLEEIIESMNSIIRINKSYINNKNLLIKEMMSDLRKSLDELKTKYQDSFK